MNFEHELRSVWITGLTRITFAGGKTAVNFKAEFIFKRDDGEPGFGPSVVIESSVECTENDTIAAIELLARSKAMAMLRRLTNETDASLDAIMAADIAEDSKTKEEREAEFMASWQPSAEE